MSKFEDEFDDIKDRAETWWRTADGRMRRRVYFGAFLLLAVTVALLQSCVQGG